MLLFFVCLPVCATDVARAQEKGQAATRAFNTAAGMYNRGLYKASAKKWSAFIQQYPQDPRLDRVHYYLGSCQLKSKQHQESIKTFQTLLSKYPSFSQADSAQYDLPRHASLRARL